ncbi:MAG: nucleotidyltransferase family protein, partial [Pseudomonadota bacterium]
MSSAIDPANDEKAFALLVACGDWPGSEERNRGVRAAHEAIEEDWHPFLVMVKRHQMSMHAASALRDAGITLPENLVRIDGEQRIRALSLAGEAARLLVSLDECGIRAIVLKGPLLSQIIYDDPAMRQSADLDLLVDWDQFRSAREALSSHGYQLFTNEPPWDDWRIEPWRRLAKDITLFHPEREISLELHHRLKSPDTLLPGIGVAQATQSITMAGREFAAFE